MELHDIHPNEFKMSYFAIEAKLVEYIERDGDRFEGGKSGTPKLSVINL